MDRGLLSYFNWLLTTRYSVVELISCPLLHVKYSCAMKVRNSSLPILNFVKAILDNFFFCFCCCCFRSVRINNKALFLLISLSYSNSTITTHTGALMHSHTKQLLMCFTWYSFIRCSTITIYPYDLVGQNLMHNSTSHHPSACRIRCNLHLFTFPRYPTLSLFLLGCHLLVRLQF